MSTVGALGDVAVSEKALRFEFMVAGSQIETSDGVSYFLVLDTDGQPEDGPLVNGASPLTFPSSDPRSYLPFVRDESHVLDREPVMVPNVSWSDYFGLQQEDGRLVMRQGRLNPDGSINPGVRELRNGSEWGIAGNKVQLVVPLSQLASGTRVPAQIEANLAVSNRNDSSGPPFGHFDAPPPRAEFPSGSRFVVDRWSADPAAFIALKTDGTPQTWHDTTPLPLFHAKLPAFADNRKVNLTGFVAVVQ